MQRKVDLMEVMQLNAPGLGTKKGNEKLDKQGRDNLQLVPLAEKALCIDPATELSIIYLI